MRCGPLLPLLAVVELSMAVLLWQFHLKYSHQSYASGFSLVQGILADAKANAQMAPDARSKLVKSAPHRKEDSKPPLPSPDDYNPFQDDLPGPPPPVSRCLHAASELQQACFGPTPHKES